MVERNAAIDPKELSRFRRAVARHLKRGNAARLMSLMEPSIELARARGNQKPSNAAGRTRLGGLPALPTKTRWPSNAGRPMTFLCQLDLAALAPLLPKAGLPRTGLLLFFHDFEDYELDGIANRRVVHVPHPENTGDETKAPPGATVLKEVALAARIVATLPDPFESDADLAMPGLEGEELTKGDDFCADHDPLIAIHDELGTPVERVHRVLGWPNLVNNADWDGCREAFHGKRDKKDVDGRGSWRLLLKLGADKHAGLAFGDVGCAAYFIREDDLRAARFDRVFLETQAS
jgi:uncharacterized protein YwqG